MKLSIREDMDIDRDEYSVNLQLFAAFHGHKFHFRARDYDLVTMISKPIAYVKYIPASPIIAGGMITDISPISDYVSPLSASEIQRAAVIALNNQPNAQAISLDLPDDLDSLIRAQAVRAQALPATVPIAPMVAAPVAAAAAPAPVAAAPVPPARPYHTIVTSMLDGISAHDLMTSDTVTKEQTMNLMRGVFIFVTEATSRVPGFRHCDLHTNNIKVNGLDVSVLDFGMTYTKKNPFIYFENHAALMTCGNWDCWKFLGHIMTYLIDHALKQRAWAVEVITTIRKFFDNDEAFVFFTRRREMKSASVKMIMNATGKPWTMDVKFGCNPFYTPTYTRDDGKVAVLPHFQEFNQNFTPERFRDYFLRH